MKKWLALLLAVVMCVLSVGFADEAIPEMIEEAIADETFADVEEEIPAIEEEIPDVVLEDKEVPAEEEMPVIEEPMEEPAAEQEAPAETESEVMEAGVYGMPADPEFAEKSIYDITIPSVTIDSIHVSETSVKFDTFSITVKNNSSSANFRVKVAALTLREDNTGKYHEYYTGAKLEKEDAQVLLTPAGTYTFKLQNGELTGLTPNTSYSIYVYVEEADGSWATFDIKYPFTTNTKATSLNIMYGGATVAGATINLGKNGSLTMDPVMEPAYTTSTVSWASSDPAVATVAANGNSCVVTGLKNGLTTIVATTDNGLQAAVNVNVVKNKVYAPKPTQAEKYSGKVQLRLKSVEVVNPYKLECEYYVINGTNKKVAKIKKFYSNVFNKFGTKLVSKTVKNKSLTVKKHSYKTLKVTYTNGSRLVNLAGNNMLEYNAELLNAIFGGNWTVLLKKR